MNLLFFFKEYLLTRDNTPSKATIKNYLADIRKFILWFEEKYQRPFDPHAVTAKTIALYKDEKLARIRRGNSQMLTFSANSVHRYLSSLRKFFSCLKENGLISTSPFDMLNMTTPASQKDEYYLKAFKNHLLLHKNAHLTIKNYIIDIRQFLEWVKKVTHAGDSYVVGPQSILQRIHSNLIEEYKNRLLHEAHLSPVSINRKLSSIRKYLNWAYDERLIEQIPLVSQNVAEKNTADSNDQSITKDINTRNTTESILAESMLTLSAETQKTRPARTYSKFPPLRLLQKLALVGNLAFEAGMILPIVFFSEKVQYLTWLISGRKIFSTFTNKALNSLPTDALPTLQRDPISKILGNVQNFKKSFYAPYQISTAGLPLHRKLIHHLRHSRPGWYRKYHSYPIVHYMHFAALVIFMSAIGFGLYRSYWLNPSEEQPVLAAAVSPPRVLSFQGRLTDSNDTPITANTNLRFAIYNNQTASGSALLWQEVQSVKPDEDGIFSVLLGKSTGIPQSVFGQNAALFLGITVGRDEELVPRQQIASVAYATNAELLQGMPAITQTNAGTANVILALDSSGNLTIGGNASPTFQATGGAFTLAGKVLNLNTTAGSNTNVVIRPDGTGIIDLQKVLQNTSNDGKVIPGAVEVEDLFSVIATDSAHAALSVTQNGGSDIIRASAGGSTRFVVNNSGGGYFAGNVGIGEQTTPSKLYINSGGDSTTIGLNTSASSTTLFNFLINGSQYAAFRRNSNGDVEWTTASGVDYIFSPSGNIGIGTTIPNSFKLQVEGNVGPNTDSTYDLGSSTLRWNNLFVNRTDSESASVSGTLTLSGLTTNGGVLYTNGSGAVSQTNAGSVGECLVSNGGSGAPVWASCTASGGTNWNVTNGTIFPKLANTLDLLIGGTSTASADFAVLNTTSGTSTTYVGGNLGIGTTNPGANLEVVGTIESSGLITANAGITIDPGQNLTLNGDAISDLVGTGLQLTGTVLETTLGTSVDLTSEVTGVLPIANGGTNLSTPPANGQLLIGNGTDYTLGTLTNGDGITITEGAGSITIASTLGTIIDLTSEVTGILPITNGGTNTNTIGGAGAIAYSTGTAYAFSGIGAPGQVLVSGGSGAPTWIDINGSVNYWQQANGALSSLNTTNDLLIGGSASSSALIKLGGTTNANSFFNTGGNVGIGTTSPVGKFNISGTGNQKALALIQGDGNQDLFTASSSGTTRFLVDKGGYVGIGTTAPLSNFHINSSTLTNQIALTTSWTGQSASSGSRIGINVIHLDFWNYETGGAINFGTQNTQRMYIAGNGNVGIGETGTSPVGKLNVVGAATGKALVILNETGNQDIFTASSSGTTRFVIANNGNVGIGTTSPGAKLDISETTGGTLRLSRNDTTVSNLDILGKLEFYSNDATAGYTGVRAKIQAVDSDIFSTGERTDLAFFTTNGVASNMTEAMRIDSQGNVGIGTTSNSGARLDVVSNGSRAGIFSSSGTGDFGVQYGIVVSSTQLTNTDTSIGGSFNATGGDTNYGIYLSASGGTNNYGLYSASGNNYFAGNVGIGTTTPGATLHVVGNIAASSSISGASLVISGTALIGSSTTINGVLDVNDEIQLNMQSIGSNALCHSTGNNNSVIRDCNGAPQADYAEMFSVAEGIEYGDIVMPGSEMVEEFDAQGNDEVTPTTPKRSIARLVKSNRPYAANVIGIVVNNRGDFTSTGHNIISDEDNPMPVALNGRVPVKVTTQNGPIQVGDYITTSSIPGVGMKATKAGYVIGKALASYTNPDPDTIGTVLVFVNNTYYDPDIYLTDTGDISIFDDPTNPSGTEYSVTNGDKPVDRIGIFREAIIGAVEAGVVNATQISAESLTIAGMSLRDYIFAIVEQIETQAPTIISPLDGKLAVNVLSPIGDDPEISLNLGKDEITIKNKSGETVASVDNTGNATFSGTLTADKIKTDDLDLSEEALARLKNRLGPTTTQSASNITNITNIYTNATDSAVTISPTPIQAATPSATPTPTISNTGDTPDTDIQSDYADIASMSGVLGYVPSLKSDFATFTQGLISLGPASLNDVSVAGQLSVNGNMILAENSINVLGADLEIQPLRQGNVSFMGGLVKIDIDGNLTVNGTATFAKNVAIKGLLSTNVISPIPDHDLVIQLPEMRSVDPYGNISIRQSDLVVQNASGSGVLRINQLGDIIASGEGRFKELASGALKIVRGAQADTSLTETVATASAGTATINRRQTERTVFSPFVKEDSLIYITPTSNTAGLTPYVARQTAENEEEDIQGSFTIQLPEEAPIDIKVNWWIIN